MSANRYPPGRLDPQRERRYLGDAIYHAQVDVVANYLMHRDLVTGTIAARAKPPVAYTVAAMDLLDALDSIADTGEERCGTRGGRPCLYARGHSGPHSWER